MKKVQKLLRRSLATGLALVMTVSSMTIVPGSWQVHAAEASGQIGISNADELKKIGKDKDYPMDVTPAVCHISKTIHHLSAKRNTEQHKQHDKSDLQLAIFPTPFF